MVRKFLIFCALVAFSQPLQATPPRYASVQDTPFGINQTHMFVLRTLSDNEGSHYITRSKRFLVAQDIETGKTEQIWPLETTRETFVDVSERTFEYHRAKPKIDPLDILSEFSAAPLTMSVATDWLDDRLQISTRVTLSYKGIIDQKADEKTVLVTSDEIRTRRNASLNSFMDSLRDDPGPVDPITFDGNAYTKNLADCFVLKMWGNVPGFDLYQLECENGEFDVLSYQIYLTIPSED